MQHQVSYLLLFYSGPSTTNRAKMKVLALHGLGSSAVMLEQQLAAVMDDLGPNYKFVFLDGSFPCESGPGELEHHTTLG